ncbi:uncharacterized protein LOC6548245 [Drosophila erecta]|uniref:Uncharacterized protein, isoform A n=1 Tax=Drosophila erecta TaxID=7220 RepID=B3NNN7_DROER|nr:uncharacterized protein LOC6548245 [Drosophila erecta]EDV55594.1 uncharacterized protein Dere_GG20698, isoform A [Drosophila erecta]KQS62345.1 uncharacterized protein Dere_GG20698, isoform B [Drosophila erecta]
MMSSRALLIAGLLLIVGSGAVFSYPQSSQDDYQMQADDDFDYGGEDQSAPSPQTKSSTPISSEKVNKTLSVTGIRGEDVVLKCDVGIDLHSSEDVVVLWYFGNNVISNGKNVVQPNFKLDPNYDLTILRASPQVAGNYLCKVLPSESVVHTKVTIAEHSLDAIAPESSTSAAGTASSFLGCTVLGSIVLLLLGMGTH